jgi:hypothetical protein
MTIPYNSTWVEQHQKAQRDLFEFIGITNVADALRHSQLQVSSHEEACKLFFGEYIETINTEYYDLQQGRFITGVAWRCKHGVGYGLSLGSRKGDDQWYISLHSPTEEGARVV